MERRESLNLPQLSELPQGLSGKETPKENQPTDADWKYLQGGKPEIVFDNKGILCVIHNYINRNDPSGTGAVVPTSIGVVDNWKHKTVRYGIDGRDVDFPVALLWKKHGKPCEANSREGYKRIKVKS